MAGKKAETTICKRVHNPRSLSFRTVPIKEDGILVSMALFTNMPVNEAINILVDKVFGNDSFKPTYDFELGKEKTKLPDSLKSPVLTRFSSLMANCMNG